jgi:hypothetical protein
MPGKCEISVLALKVDMRVRNESDLALATESREALRGIEVQVSET